MKKLLIASAVAVAIAAPAAQAAVKISGQVSQAVLFGGDVTDVTTVDNATAGSRFRFKAAKKFGNGLTAGMRYELQAQDNSSSNGNDGTISEVRYSDIFLKGSFGKIAIGKGDGAANGTFESYGILNFLGASEAHLLYQNDGFFDGAGTDYRDIDGTSRENRIRYDSPNFNGFKFAATVDNGDKNEFAVNYNGKVGGGKLRVRAGIVDGDTEELTSYSAAYKHGSGFGAAYSYGENDLTDADVDWKMLSYTFGKATISYGKGEESSGDDLGILSLNYKPTKGVEVYLNKADWDNANLTEGDALSLGARFKF